MRIYSSVNAVGNTFFYKKKIIIINHYNNKHWLERDTLRNEQNAGSYDQPLKSFKF